MKKLAKNPTIAFKIQGLNRNNQARFQMQIV